VSLLQTIDLPEAREGLTNINADSSEYAFQTRLSLAESLRNVGAAGTRRSEILKPAHVSRQDLKHPARLDLPQTARDHPRGQILPGTAAAPTCSLRKALLPNQGRCGARSTEGVAPIGATIMATKRRVTSAASPRIGEAMAPARGGGLLMGKS